MKTPLLPIYLGVGLLASLSAQEAPAPAPAKPAEGVDKMRLAAKHAAAVNNLKQIGMALFEFDTDFGSYPDGETAKAVKEATGTAFKLQGKTSNDYFRQLIAGAGVKTEKIFQFGQAAKPADDKFTTEAEALAPGECDFAYLPGAAAFNDPDRPLVVGPLVPGKMEFDPAVFGGRAVILRIDNSVTSQSINQKGEVILNGKSLFDPSQGYWQGKKPEVAWPK